MRWFVIFWLAALAVAAEEKKIAADLCVPPPGPAAPKLPAKILAGQGIVHFPITTNNPEAQKFFDQGVAQMHSFWSREAERSFLQAAELDPGSPMPQWGIAMVAAGDWRPRFQIDTFGAAFGRQARSSDSRAVRAAQKAVELSQIPGSATDLEKMYIAAVAARRDASAKDPEDAYVKAMRALLAKYPKEVEARSYLALMIMRGFTLPGKNPKHPGSAEAAQILRELMLEAPDHPGVHHYVIHGFEGSSFAKDAWPSCRRYAELVPNIPHALHMPGHIWSQTGKWDEAIKSFDAAAVNERGYMKADALYGSGHHGHNVHYLATAYAFSGNYDKAIEAARELLAIPENPREKAQLDNMGTAQTQGFYALMRTLVQFSKWDLIMDEGAFAKPLKPRQVAWWYWARGLAAAAKPDAAGAERELSAMEAALAGYRSQVRNVTPAELAVARDELRAQIQLASGHIGKGLKGLERAARAERRLTYTEPPFYPRPVLQVLGAEALRNGKRDLAQRAYREAQVQYPENWHAKPGL